VKPARFEYAAPRTLDEALGILASTDDDVSMLAGGQSLVPLLNMRMAQPELVVDLNRVEGLDELSGNGAGPLTIGTMVRQHRLETEPVIRERVPLLVEAVKHVAHVPIRMRGTVGGSLAHADPSAELPAAVSALDGRMVLRSQSGSRTLAAADFFRGALMTAIEPGELLVEIEVTPPPAGTGWAFTEIARTHGAFALAGVAALLHTGSDGRIDHARLALCGVGGRPYVPAWLDEMALGEKPGDELFAAIGRRVSEDVDPFGDGHAGPEYRRRVAGTLATRALGVAAQRIGEAA
jgi:carbon-monoxide dehydrogenase medium subunit